MFRYTVTQKLRLIRPGGCPTKGNRSSGHFAFGAQRAIWGEFTADVQAAQGRIARAIAEFQPVTVFCRERERQLAEATCGSHNVSYVVTELDDIWVRDFGANFVVNGAGELGAVDFNFNGWGNKQRHAKDARLAAFAANRYGAAQLRRSALIGEGGGIEVDGHGTGIMTESSWVNANRNPGWSRDRVEQELKAMLGLRKIIWLPGIKGRDITDAHVDFTPASCGRVWWWPIWTPIRTLMTMQLPSNIWRSSAATDADGRRLQVHTLSPPLAPRDSRFSRNNPDFAAGYINYFVINGAVIAPEFGDPQADRAALELLTALYPQRKVVQLEIDAIAAGGGGIHCATNQLPV